LKLLTFFKSKHIFEISNILKFEIISKSCHFLDLNIFSKCVSTFQQIYLKVKKQTKKYVTNRETEGILDNGPAHPGLL
jgi:hypothetical protein